MNRFLELEASLNSIKNKRNLPLTKVRKYSRQKSKVDLISPIIEATKLIISNEGDIKWELDQWDKVKHPISKKHKKKHNNPLKHTRTFTVSETYNWWAGSISADFEVRFSYNDYSLGHVFITTIATNDSAGKGLHVTARIVDDPSNHGDIASLLIRFNYRFTHTFGDDTFKRLTYRIKGDGTYLEINE